MKKIAIVMIAAGWLAAAPPPLAAADCKVQFRLWQDGRNTYFDHGEEIVLQVGEKADFYVHTDSRSATPYSTRAEIGAPADFDIGSHRRPHVDRVLRLSHGDPLKGKVSVAAIAAGRTALGYRIDEVARPGRLEGIRPGCRTGQVHITVERRSGADSPSRPASRTAGEAAHELIVNLLTGILRRTEERTGDYPNGWFDRVEENGLEGLVVVAGTLTGSAEFRDTALRRTETALGASGHRLGRDELEAQLLTDICRSLYGDLSLDRYSRERLANTLGACLAGGEAGSCQRLGRDLVRQREYSEHHRQLLRHWRY